MSNAIEIQKVESAELIKQDARLQELKGAIESVRISVEKFITQVAHCEFGEFTLRNELLQEAVNTITTELVAPLRRALEGLIANRTKAINAAKILLELNQSDVAEQVLSQYGLTIQDIENLKQPSTRNKTSTSSTGVKNVKKFDVRFGNKHQTLRLNRTEWVRLIGELSDTRWQELKERLLQQNIGDEFNESINGNILYVRRIA